MQVEYFESINFQCVFFKFNLCKEKISYQWVSEVWQRGLSTFIFDYLFTYSFVKIILKHFFIHTTH
jgi:hypothetical protein